VSTKVRVVLTDPPGHGPSLSAEARQFLPALKDWCVAHGVRVAYSLPRGYAPATQIKEFQKGNADFLRQMVEFIPVLKDESLGADTHTEHYADSAWHLNEEGSRLRTDELGRAVQQWDLWRVEELRQLAGLR
jgi:hypothetical protein